MAQHAIFFPRLQINSKIFYYRPFDDLPSFTSFHSFINYSDRPRSLVLKSVTERNSVSCALRYYFRFMVEFHGQMSVFHQLSDNNLFRELSATISRWICYTMFEVHRQDTFNGELQVRIEIELFEYFRN